MTDFLWAFMNKRRAVACASVLGALGVICFFRRRHRPYRHPLANICADCSRYVDLGSVDPDRTVGVRR